MPTQLAVRAGGQTRIQDVTVESVRAAVRQMPDNRFAAEKFDEAARLQQPTRRQFGETLARWVAGD